MRPCRCDRPGAQKRLSAGLRLSLPDDHCDRDDDSTGEWPIGASSCGETPLRREAGGPGLAVVGVALVYLSPVPAEYRGTLAKGAVVLAAVDRGQIPGREVVVATEHCLHVLAPAVGRHASYPFRLVVAPAKDARESSGCLVVLAAADRSVQALREVVLAATDAVADQPVAGLPA